MKKLLLLLGLALTLTGCGASESQEKEETAKQEVTEEIINETEMEKIVETEEVTEKETEETEETMKGYKGINGIYEFSDNVTVINSIYDENQKIMIIPMTFTNLSDQPKDPWIAFAMDIQAYQADESSTYLLMGGMTGVPEEYKEEMNKLTNPDATVEYNLSLALENENPVQLKDFYGNVIKEIPVQ